MNPATLFINPQTSLLRSPWRMLVFITLSPQFFLLASADGQENRTDFGASPTILLSYAIFIIWTVLLSWFCLFFFEHLNLKSLGFALSGGWRRHILMGAGIGALMVISVVGLQIIGGGTRVIPNPVWWEGGAIDYYGLQRMAFETLAALVLLSLSGSFEELIYRGYPFQTLLRGAPAFVPILLFALFFGISHLGNPGSTFFSTANTILAGIWLSVAYLKTRSLWFTSSLHVSWNWMMGAFFGLPVSGFRIPRNPILASTSDDPAWLTGGSYGCEGGAAATVVIIVATILIWRAKKIETLKMENLTQSHSTDASRQASSF
jgi:membrane protease YdiL (CAAX protease family)